jgi:type III restriction enzyme
MAKSGNKLKEFDWWLFSKLEESLDQVYITYYNPKSNDISKFKPDFIFWLQKGKNYYIVFIDPKGIAYSDYQHKIDGYKEIFEENNSKVKKLLYGKLNTRIFTFLYTHDVIKASAA